ncbi:CLUMA_CG012377, isoform A [Clunio marinus]|uniref:CLUMA_CG012377, isoform A n=1 Tax=Clunio marinus TaxID=568069 RepID=A0A1J1II02_9DIPT|nr:CLUMA_CG012377, isoform A [Clunio marinus]
MNEIQFNKKREASSVTDIPSFTSKKPQLNSNKLKQLFFVQVSCALHPKLTSSLFPPSSGFKVNPGFFCKAPTARHMEHHIVIYSQIFISYFTEKTFQCLQLSNKSCQLFLLNKHELDTESDIFYSSKSLLKLTFCDFNLKEDESL